MDTLFSEALAHIKELYTAGKREEARQAVIKFSNDNQNELSTEAGKAYLHALIEYTSEWLNEEVTKEAYMIRASAYVNLEEYERAIEDYDTAIELDPDYAVAYYNRGNSYYDLKKYERAIEDYDKSIELDTSYEAAYYNRGNGYVDLKEYERAIADYDKAIELDPKYAAAYYNRGNSYYELKEYERAIADYDKAIELDPKYAAAYYNRGNIYYELKEYERAIEDYDKSIELNPDYTSAYNYRGNSYFSLKEYERAIEDYDKSIELNPNDASAYYNRGNTYYELKESERALEDYDTAIELDPDYAYAYNNRGNRYYDLKEYERALDDYDKAIELDPDYTYAYHNRGNTYRGLNEHRKAIENYSKAIELDPDYASAYYNRGFSYEELKEFELALSSFKKYIQLPDDKFWIEQARAKIIELEERIGDGDYVKVFDIIDDIKEVLMFKQGNITHYTGIGTAKALIINESKFRLSEATFLNDTSEGMQLSRYLDIAEYKKEAGKELIAELYTQKPFIGSFVSSDQCDDLTLWRMYGKESNEEAKGCSLTISSEAFVNQIKANLEIDDKDAVLSLDNEFTFYRVAYIQEDHSILIPGAEEKQEELKNSLKSLKESLETYKGELPLKVREKLSEISYLFKQAHYQYEREVRLVISGVGFDKKVDSTFEIPRVYIELGSVLSAVPKMTIGPKVERSEEWAAAFYYCFEEKDADCEITISRLPFK